MEGKQNGKEILPLYFTPNMERDWCLYDGSNLLAARSVKT